jgi:hypothetical protein
VPTTPPPPSPPGPRSLVSDADREQLLRLLREHYAQEQLDLDEMSRRVGVVLASTYSDEAAAAVTDLPVLGRMASGEPSPARASRRCRMGSDTGEVPRPFDARDHAGLDRPGRLEPPLRARARRLNLP